MKITKKLQKRIIQFVEYMIAGGAYFWIGYGAFFAFDKGLHWNLFATTIVSNLIGWSVNFILQRYWVFRNPRAKGHMGESTGKYILITLVNFGLNYLILLWLKHLGITPYIGQFISSGFFTVWNYLWYKLWVFPDRYKKPKIMKRRVRR